MLQLLYGAFIGASHVWLVFVGNPAFIVIEAVIAGWSVGAHLNRLLEGIRTWLWIPGSHKKAV